MMRRVAVEHITETAKTALRGIATSGAAPATREALARAVIGGLNRYQLPAHARAVVLAFWQGVNTKEST